MGLDFVCRVHSGGAFRTYDLSDLYVGVCFLGPVAQEAFRIVHKAMHFDQIRMVRTTSKSSHDSKIRLELVSVCLYNDG